MQPVLTFLLAAAAPLQGDHPPHLVEQVTLEYPVQAQGLHGDVVVLVQVDASGKVVSVQVLSGPESFHEAALHAAQRLSFDPALQDGVPVAGRTEVRFHFEPPSSANEATMRLVVHETLGDEEASRVQTTVDRQQLDEHAGQDLATSLEEDVPGLIVATGTAAASKPILRGQTERRLVVMHDGVRHASQSWGPDHGTEINPFTAGQVRVVRGTASARYGADAVGGVIVVDPAPMRAEAGLGGRVAGGFVSNGLRPSVALTVDAVPQGAPALSLRAHGDLSVGKDQSAPDYVLANTASRHQNWALATQAQVPGGRLRASWSHYGLQAGVFAGMQTASSQDFEQLLALEQPPGSEDWEATWAVDRAFQDVKHDLWSLHGEREGDFGALSAVYAFQRNRRLEFERVRPGIEGAQYDFILRTHSLDLAWVHPHRELGAWEAEGSMGLQGSFQENVYRGYTLIPNFRAVSGGAFLAERLSRPRVDVDLGLRYDTLARSAYLGDQEAARLETLPCTPQDTLQRCDARYGAVSASLGALVHVVPEHLDARVELSKSTRNPSVDELYLAGVAPTLPMYTQGDPTLGPETTWGLSTALGVRGRWVEGDVAAYGHQISGYITQAQRRLSDGDPAFKVTTKGAWPIVDSQAQDVRLAGVEGLVKVNPQGLLELRLSGSAIRAQDLAGGGVVGIPADRLRTQLLFHPRPLPWLQSPELGISVLGVAQAKGAGSLDWAPPPEGYALLGASASTTLVLAEREVRLGLAGHNLLNAEYRDYNALLRPYADQPGRAVRLSFSTPL